MHPNAAPAAIPSSLRKINRRMILRHMVQVPSAARGQLALAAGTSAVTAGKIVDELLEQGVLEEVDLQRAVARPGRPGQNLRLNTRLVRFVLVQVGVAHTRLAVAALGAAADLPWAAEIPTAATAAEWEKTVAAVLADIVPAPGHEGSALWGVLVSLPGVVDEDAGRVLFSPNLHWSEGVDFRKVLGGMLSVPVELVQEIRALALGELAHSPEHRDFLLVDFGHGMGGATIIGGGLFQSPLPLTGELGHTPVPENTRPCGCGAIGCVETLLSRGGLFKSIQELPASAGPAGRAYSWDIVESHIQARGLEPWLQKSLQIGAAAIAGAMNSIGLGHVVITGTVTGLSEEIRQFFSSEIRRGLMWAKFGPATIEFAPRRRMHGLINVGIERLVVGL